MSGEGGANINNSADNAGQKQQRGGVSMLFSKMEERLMDESVITYVAIKDEQDAQKLRS